MEMAAGITRAIPPSPTPTSLYQIKQRQAALSQHALGQGLGQDWGLGEATRTNATWRARVGVQFSALFL